MRPASLPTAASLLVLALLVAACGGSAGATQRPAATGGPAATDAPTDAPDDAEPTPGTALNACEIITPDDVKAATGAGAVEDGELREKPTSLSPGKTECTYEGDWGRLIVELTPEDGENLYDAARGSYKDASDITGTGDGAFSSKQNNRAFVWQGAVTAMFTMFLNDAEQRAAAESLAKAVVAKL